jgi:hypothetical protein
MPDQDFPIQVILGKHTFLQCRLDVEHWQNKTRRRKRRGDAERTSFNRMGRNTQQPNKN